MVIDLLRPQLEVTKEDIEPIFIWASITIVILLVHQIHLLKIPQNRILQNIKNEILNWIGNKSVTIDAFHYFKKYASYALTVNTLENNQNYHKLWIINLSQ